MDTVDRQAFSFVLANIRDGDLFESFAQEFLAGVLGCAFQPVGGMHDRGIDGLEHLFAQHGSSRTVYQASIEKQPKAKVERTIEALKKHNVQFDLLCYVTNVDVKDKDILEDQLLESTGVNVRLWDHNWFVTRVNTKDETVRTYHTFVKQYLHEYATPGSTYEVADLELDPRIYVFLRQQMETSAVGQNIEEVLVDALILFALEGTDPDEQIFMNAEEVIDRIHELVRFDIERIKATIMSRLSYLADKPRTIGFHKRVKGYCLNYSERTAIHERNIHDLALHEEFIADTRQQIKRHISSKFLAEDKSVQLVDSFLHKLFVRQGLQLAEIFTGDNASAAVIRDLPDVVAEMVSESTLIKEHHRDVTHGLLLVIRDMVYNGTAAQRLFLEKLSRTYLMMLLLQCDPAVANYFRTMAGSLTIFVDSSIILPALSEYFLDDKNRRFHNLLKGAQRAGVDLVIPPETIDELASHFIRVQHVYRDQYAPGESKGIFDEDEEVLYVKEILIRAFYYSKHRGKVETWSEFINSFVNPNLRNVHQDIVQYLETTYGIRYATAQSLGVNVPDDETKKLGERLAKFKAGGHGEGQRLAAMADAHVVLTVFKIREKNNEIGTGGVLGYSTWWLSTDSTTHRSLVDVFGNRYRDQCYMRPDFLYTFIALAPGPMEIDGVLADLFPTVLGVNISYRVADEVVDAVHQFIKDHQQLSAGRIKSALRELTASVITHAGKWTGRKVRLFLDEELKEVETSGR